MTRVLFIGTGLPRVLREIVSQSLAHHADVKFVATDAPSGGLVAAVRESGADVIVGAEGQFGHAEVSSLLDNFPRSRVFTLAPDARMTWLCELRPHRVALGEMSPHRLAGAICVSNPSTVEFVRDG